MGFIFSIAIAGKKGGVNILQTAPLGWRDSTVIKALLALAYD